MTVKRKVNLDFFKVWSEDMAYVLGFFYADGTFDISARGAHYFGFHICDMKLLYAIRKTLKSNHKIAQRKVRANESRRYRLQIGSKEMCGDLNKLGVTPAKTRRMELPIIPQKYFSHFVRGYFDGDGHVWTGLIHKGRGKTHRTLQVGFTSCSRKFLDELYRHLGEFGMVGGGVYCKKNAFCIKYSTSDSIQLYKLMYGQLGTSPLVLKRKKTVFEQFIKMRS